MPAKVLGFGLEINLQHNMPFDIAYVVIQNSYFFIWVHTTS